MSYSISSLKDSSRNKMNTMICIEGLEQVFSIFHVNQFNDNHHELILEQYLILKMTIGIQKRDRCRLCYTLILRDRTSLFSSICCQKYYHVFKPIQRTKMARKSSLPYAMNISTRTVCFRDLIVRYLRTDLQAKKYFSNFICNDCSKVLLEIEQCAKYLTKTVNQLKRKFNKSNRLVTSSLSATFQKKQPIIKHEQLPIVNSDDDDEEFDDLDEDEKSDEEIEDTKPMVSTNPTTSKSRHFNSPSSACESLTNRTNNNNGDCTDDEDDDEEEDDADEEEGLVSKSQSTKPKTSLEFSQKNNIAALANASDPSMHLLDGFDPNNFQLRLAHMMANIAAASSSSSSSSPHQNMDAMMNSFANMQRNLLKMFTNPMATAQVTAAQMKSNVSPISTHDKQSAGGRKRKSTPEKRVITNHRSTNNNNGNTSPTPPEHESMNNSTDDLSDHPLELTVKDSQRSNRTTHTKGENGSSSYPHLDDDHKEITTPNDSSLSLSPSLNRRSTTSKRARLSTINQYDYANNLSMVNLPPSTTDLLSPNHHQTLINDDNQQRQQRKLDPRPCAECGKVLFSDKTHLLHCQTHAKNEKQCWICGKNDEDIKKHILNEHGNQKFTNTGFKCQHCDKVFPDFSDLQTHTREHSKKKPFECPICHKRFGQQGNLSCHLRIHSGVKPFTCNNCGKAFRHSNSLRRHARTVHSAARGLTSTSLLLPTNTTALSNDYKTESFDDGPSGLMLPSDDGSSSTGGIPSPSISNTPVDSD